MNIPPEELKKAADSILNLPEDELKRLSEEHEVKEPLNLTRLVDDFFNRSDEELMADIKKFENDPDFIMLKDVETPEWLKEYFKEEE